MSCGAVTRCSRTTGKLVQKRDESCGDEDQQHNVAQARVRPDSPCHLAHPWLDVISWTRAQLPRVLDDPSPRTVEADCQDDRQEEDLDARDPDGLEVDENRDVLEERLGEPDRPTLCPSTVETWTQR